jgi:CRP-like cAMP-binding protein
VTLVARLERQVHSPGSRIIERGTPARELFLIEVGRASVTIDLPDGQRRRLATLGPGMIFGEAALLEGGPRTADVRADSEVRCLVLTSTAFDALEVEHPAIAAALLRNLLRSVGATAARLTAEVAVLAG